jgi:hypothetical protein
VSDSIFLVGNDGSLTEAHGTPYVTEDELQKLLADHVHLLPGAQIDQETPRRWLLIKREAGVPNREGGGDWWSVDHLVVDQDAVPTFVEVKRASDTRARREVVAQMLDYAANGSAFWSVDQLRSWYEAGHPEDAADRLAAWLGPSEDDAETVADEFWQAVGNNLREGRVRLLFVADEIPATLQRLVEFLNEQMPRVEVLAVEIRQYRTAGDAGALVPRLVGQTSRAQAVKERATPVAHRAVPWTVEEVLDAVAHFGTGAAAVARTVSDWAASQPHIKVSGGHGVSYPSFTLSADTGHGRSPFVGVLSLYASPNKGERPMVEVRVKQMCQTPPYNGPEQRERLTADLRGLGVPRLDIEQNLTDKRPNIPFEELTDGRLERLLAIVGDWVEAVWVNEAVSAPEKGGR